MTRRSLNEESLPIQGHFLSDLLLVAEAGSGRRHEALQPSSAEQLSSSSVLLCEALQLPLTYYSPDTAGCPAAPGSIVPMNRLVPEKVLVREGTPTSANTLRSR